MGNAYASHFCIKHENVRPASRSNSRRRPSNRFARTPPRSSTPTTLRTLWEYNKGNATSGLLASQGLLTNLNDYVSEYGWDKIITGSLADTGKYGEQGVMGSGDWCGITTGAVK